MCRPQYCDLHQTAKYAPLVKAVSDLDIDRAIIDVELNSVMASWPDQLIFMAFDLLHLGEHDLRRMAGEEYRHILHPKRTIRL